MTRRTKSWWARASVLWVLALAGVASAAPSAEAVPVIIDPAGAMAGAGGGVAPPISDVRLVNAGAGIPANGALLIYAGGGTGTAPLVEVSDVATPGTFLGGTLTVFMTSWYWVWVPSAPFTEGSTYQVRLSAPDSGISSSDTFEAVAPIAVARPEITTAPSASWHSETNNWACCQSLFSGVLQDTSCFPSEQRASVTLEPGLFTSENAVFMNQFLFRIGVGTAAAATGQLSVWPNVVTSAIYEQAEEYCFELEAVDIVSGAVFTYDDVAHCAPHGELGDLGITTIEPGAAELDRLVCHAPPAQFKDQWCELNEDPCADDDMATACGLYGYVCEGEPLPPDPFSGMAGFGGMAGGLGGFGGMVAGGFGGIGAAGGEGGASGMNEGGEGGASGMNDGGGGGDDTTASHGDGGCSVSSAGGKRSSATGFALIAAALVLSRPFRRTRSRAAR